MKITDALALVPEAEREAIKEPLALVLAKIGAVDLTELVMLKTTEDAKKLLDNPLMKPVVTSTVDSAVSKGVEAHDKKFIADKLPGLVDAEVKKLHPEADPKDQKLSAMEKKLADMEREGILKDQRTRATMKAAELKIPVALALTAVGLTDEETDKAVKALADTLTPWREEALNEFKKTTFGNLPPPPGGPKTSVTDLETKYAEAEKAGNALEMMRLKAQIAAAPAT